MRFDTKSLYTSRQNQKKSQKHKIQKQFKILQNQKKNLYFSKTRM